MSTAEGTLARFYEGWGQYQAYLVEAVGGLTPEQLALRAAPSLRPAWLLVAHIIGARIGWFHITMGEGGEELMPMDAWDRDGEPQRSAAELVTGLQATWALIESCLARWTPAMLDDTFTTRRGRTITRQQIIWHIIEHDIHHGGELFFTLGMHGLPTPDL